MVYNTQSGTQKTGDQVLREMFVYPVGRVRAANLARLDEWGQTNCNLTSNLRGVGDLTFGEVERLPGLQNSKILTADEKADQLGCDIDAQETISWF